MKNTSLIFIFLLAVANAHEGHHGQSVTQEVKQISASDNLKIAYQSINQNYAKSVQPIFEAKCASCHSSIKEAPWYAHVPIVGHVIQTDRREAKEHLEISHGFPFAGHGTPSEDVKSIEETILKDTMPTGLYSFFHPSARLTEDEKTVILEWIKQSKTILDTAETSK